MCCRANPCLAFQAEIKNTDTSDHDLPESLHVLHKRNSLSYIPFSVLGMDPTHPTHVPQGHLNTLSYPFPSVPLLYTSWHNDFQLSAFSFAHLCQCINDKPQGASTSFGQSTWRSPKPFEAFVYIDICAHSERF